MPDVPAPAGLAWRPALERMGGDVAGFVQLLGGFPQAMFDLLPPLAAAMQRRDLDSAIRQLHTLKGLGRTFGAEALASLSQMLELRTRSCGRDHPVPVSSEEYAGLRTLIHQAAHDAEALSQWLAVPQSASGHACNASMGELRQLLLQSNLDALDVFLRLDPALGQRSPHTHLALCQALQQLDFSQALRHCDALADGVAP